MQNNDLLATIVVLSLRLKKVYAMSDSEHEDDNEHDKGLESSP